MEESSKINLLTRASYSHSLVEQLKTLLYAMDVHSSHAVHAATRDDLALLTQEAEDILKQLEPASDALISFRRTLFAAIGSVTPERAA